MGLERRTRLIAAVAAVQVLASCVNPVSTASSSTTPSDLEADDVAPGELTTTSTTSERDQTVTRSTPDDDRCGEPTDAVEWVEAAEVDVPIVAELDDGTVVRAAVYPRPDYEAELWSQWGQGIVLDDGRVLSAIGDHAGVDGNSFLYVYDPGTHRLAQIGDVLSVTGHAPGDWGFGKIHSQMVHGPCSDVLVSTYWGTRRGLEFSDEYRGDILLRIDPIGETISQLGDVILDGHGVASVAATPDGSRVYAEAADPLDEAVGAFVVLDGYTGERLFVERRPEVDGFRAMSVTSEGAVVFTWSGDGVAVFDPHTESLSVTDSALPGEKLRASERVGDRVVAVTQNPPRFFEVLRAGEVEPLGNARGYTTSITSPDGRRYWYIPDAHGGAFESGTPLIEFDAVTGSDQVLIELNPTAGRAIGMRLGGTYNITSSADGSEVYIGLNGAAASEEASFGEVIFVVVELP